jgi:hypothetical protein
MRHFKNPISILELVPTPFVCIVLSQSFFGISVWHVFYDKWRHAHTKCDRRYLQYGIRVGGQLEYAYVNKQSSVLILTVVFAILVPGFC